MKNCVIISGHSRGLGRALAEYYLLQGRKVIGLSRTGWDNPPDNLTEYTIDFADAQNLSTLLQSAAVQTALESIDELILINNAGVVEPNALVGTQKNEEIIKAVTINVTAPILLTNSVIAMAKRANIRIAHISSGAARHAIAGWSVYGATKAALDQHAAVVAAENHAHVRIASVAPGVIDTDMQQGIRSADVRLFPEINHFIDLKINNKLQTAQDTARRIAAMIAEDCFGQVTQRDVRE